LWSNPGPETAIFSEESAVRSGDKSTAKNRAIELMLCIGYQSAGALWIQFSIPLFRLCAADAKLYAN
jgi:hypothetical protein